MATTRDSAKRSREQDSLDNYSKVPRFSNHDKLFLRELIRESEYIMGGVIKNSIKESEEKLLRESEYIMTEVIKKSIKESEEKHFEVIKNMLKESEERILAVIKEKVNNLTNEITSITERVNKLEKKILEDVNVVGEIMELKRKILKQENSVVAGSIRIVGIPYYENEDLNTIIENICNSLNLKTPQIENVYRLNKIYKNNKPYKPTDEVIVAKFHSPFEKNFLLKTISKYRHDNQKTLSLRQAGFDSDEPIYVNENLTPHNHKIFKEAQLYKKSKKIKSAFTLRGLVYVRKFDSDEPVLLEFPDDLKMLFRE